MDVTILAPCVIGRCAIMNKLPQRVAYALPLSRSYRRTSASYITAAFRVTNGHSSPSASTCRRANNCPSHAPHSPRTHPYTSIHTMSSDAEYAAFLDKANQDVAPAEQQGVSKKGYGTKSVDTVVPKALESVEEYYVSDADEPFEPVALEFEGSSVSASTYPKSKMWIWANTA